MKLGICVNMLPLSGDGTGREYIEQIAKLGYDYVELPAYALSQVDDREIAAIQQELLRAGLPCRAANHAMPKDLTLVGPEADHQRGLAFLRGLFPKLAALDVQYFIYGSPWSKYCPAGWPQEKAVEQLADFLRQAAVIAEEFGLTYVIEPNNHEETNMINTFGQAVALAKMVDSPSVKVLQDYFHLRLENDTVDDILRWGKEYLVHTHFARIEGRRYAVSLAEDDYYQVYADALRAVGYEGGISMEAFVDSPESWKQEAAASLEFMRKLFG